MGTRYERVVLELDDRFTTDMARAAAAAAVLNKEFDSLSTDAVRTRRSVSDIDSSVRKAGDGAESSGKQIDKLSGRLSILIDLAAALGPGLIPIAAVGVPAIGAVGASLGFAAAAAGTTVLAFQGIGTALDALNKAGLDPTAENLSKAEQALNQLSPAAAAFARELHEMMPALAELQGAAATGLFPGATEGLRDLQTALPELRDVVFNIASGLGQIAADTGESLSSDRWMPFLEFVGREAPVALSDMAQIAGNLGHTMAELWMAFQPTNDDLFGFLVKATDDLDRWAAGLDQTQGFQDFIAYIQETGPQVVDTFGALANAVLQIVEAAAPLGGPVLKGVEALANLVASIADADLGTPLFTAAAALGLFNRALGVTNSIRGGIGGFGDRLTSAGKRTQQFSLDIRQVREDLAILATTAGTAGARTERELLRAQTASQRLKTSLAPIGKTAGFLTGIAVAGTGAADGLGLTNTASLALMGSIGGAPGAAAGGLIGLLLDAKGAAKDFGDAMHQADQAIDTGNVDLMREKLAELNKQRDDLVNQTGVGDFFSDLSKFVFTPPWKNPVDEIDAKRFQIEWQTAFQEVANTVDGVAALMQHGFDATAAGIDTATQSAEDFRTELERVNEVLTGQANFSSFQESIDALGDRLNKRAEIQRQLNDANARAAAATTPEEQKQAADEIARLNAELENYKNTLDTTTPAGRANAEILRNIATSAFNYAQTLKDPGLRAGFLDNARDEYIKTAESLGVTKKRAKEMADEVGLLNLVKGKVTIEVDATGAVRIIDEVQRKLDKLLKNPAYRKLLLTLNQQTAENKRGEAAANRPFSDGGWTGPGAKYDVAGVVHADEYVFSKEATRGNVAFLDLMHKRMRGYADGGYVSRPAAAARPVSVSVSSGLSDGDVQRLALAMAQIRPLHGDVTLMPHDYNEFLRQMDASRRGSGLDGLP